MIERGDLTPGTQMRVVYSQTVWYLLSDGIRKCIYTKGSYSLTVNCEYFHLMVSE